jgi:hypothetical protein
LFAALELHPALVAGFAVSQPNLTSSRLKEKARRNRENRGFVGLLLSESRKLG